MNNKRIQLTLFLDEQASRTIEQVRKTFNPEQYALIRAHVTLCREHELEQLDRVIRNLTGLDSGHITIAFGPVVRFSEGKGVLIPGSGDNEPFHRLRERILQGLVDRPAKHEPHITLMHPRNSTCNAELFAQIEQAAFPDKIEFRKISLIEQESGQKWRLLNEFDLR